MVLSDKLDKQAKGMQEMEKQQANAEASHGIEIKGLQTQQIEWLEEKQYLEQRTQQLFSQISELNQQVDLLSNQKQEEQVQNAETIKIKNQELEQASQERLQFLEEQQKQQTKIEQLNKQIFQYDNMVNQMKLEKNKLSFEITTLNKSNQQLQQ